MESCDNYHHTLLNDPREFQSSLPGHSNTITPMHLPLLDSPVPFLAVSLPHAQALCLSLLLLSLPQMQIQPSERADAPAACFGYKGENPVSVDRAEPGPSESEGGRVPRRHVPLASLLSELPLSLCYVWLFHLLQIKGLLFPSPRLQLLPWHMKDLWLTPLSMRALSQKSSLYHSDIRLRHIPQPLVCW